MEMLVSKNSDTYNRGFVFWKEADMPPTVNSLKEAPKLKGVLEALKPDSAKQKQTHDKRLNSISQPKNLNALNFC